MTNEEKAGPFALEVGDVVQISPEHESFFRGCFMLVTEVKVWGAQGFVAMPGKRDEMPGRAYYRCRWEHMAHIGRAAWVLDDDVPAEEIT
jgi:hypothetical protein